MLMDLGRGTAMSETVQQSRPEVEDVAPHDHAWRKIHLDTSDPFRIVGEYRCDLCSATWSM
jgi:hypothetical protein